MKGQEEDMGRWKERREWGNLKSKKRKVEKSRGKHPTRIEE